MISHSRRRFRISEIVTAPHKLIVVEAWLGGGSGGWGLGNTGVFFSEYFLSISPYKKSFYIKEKNKISAEKIEKGILFRIKSIDKSY